MRPFTGARAIALFCQHCGRPIADGSVFCNYCGGRQGVVTAPSAIVDAICDEEYTNVQNECQDINGYELPGGRVLHLRAIVESGGPYELLMFDEDDELFKTFAGIATDQTFELVLPETGSYGFGFRSAGQPGTVRLQVY